MSRKVKFTNKRKERIGSRSKREGAILDSPSSVRNFKPGFANSSEILLSLDF